MSGDLMVTILWMSNKNFWGLVITVVCILVACAWIGFLFDWDLNGIRQAKRTGGWTNNPVLNGHNSVNRSGTNEDPRHRARK